MDGSRSYVARSGMDVLGEFLAPCGQCEGCRIEHAAQWKTRCLHELKSHDAASFLSLTYDDAHLPEHGSLRYSDVQKFFRRLRRSGQKFRFFCCGEYGSTTFRPHYHVICYGQDFKEGSQPLAKSPSGHGRYFNQALTDLWGHGSVDIGSVTSESIGYVTQYALKKVNGDRAEAHYRVVDPDTGEISHRVPEFIQMSRSPGIGGLFLDRFASDVQGGYAVVDGRKVPVPKAYIRRFNRELTPALVQRLDDADYDKFLIATTPQAIADRQPERLAVRKQVLLARQSAKKRVYG